MARLMDLFPPLSMFRDDFAEPAWSGAWGTFAEEGYPNLNVWEHQEKVVVEAELPGVVPADIDVSVTGADLTVSGNRKAPEPANATWSRQERPSGSFNRTVTLPWDIEPEKVDAVLREGVLTITLTKAAYCRPKKVTVQTA